MNLANIARECGDHGESRRLYAALLEQLPDNRSSDAMHSRPPLRPLAGRPLRVGYVFADFCQHTVGLNAGVPVITWPQSR